MPKAVLNHSSKQYIRDNRLSIPSSAIAKHLGVSKTVVQRFLTNEGIKPPADIIAKFRIKAMTGKTSFTSLEDDFIRVNYLLYPIKVLAQMMGRSYTGIMKRISCMELSIPEDIKERNIAAGRIQKGNIPVNKGKKMPEEMYEKCKATMFKKGNVPGNATEMDGVISIRKDQTGIAYQYIRLALGKWEPLHRIKWVKEHGAIPRGTCIVFKDGDSMNCDLDNLELITRKELRLRNSGSTILSDRYVANTISRKNRDLADMILADRPDLIELKRQSLLLNRTINDQRNNHSND
jgi:hypothetical protein